MPLAIGLLQLGFNEAGAIEPRKQPWLDVTAAAFGKLQ